MTRRFPRAKVISRQRDPQTGFFLESGMATGADDAIHVYDMNGNPLPVTVQEHILEGWRHYTSIERRARQKKNRKKVTIVEHPANAHERILYDGWRAAQTGWPSTSYQEGHPARTTKLSDREREVITTFLHHSE